LFLFRVKPQGILKGGNKMSKGFSGHFHGTKGFLASLGEDYFDRYMPDGKKNVDFSHLPGFDGIQVKKRLSDSQMIFLTNEYGVEFAQVYELGNGKNGHGGRYIIYSGDSHSVKIHVNERTILINHTHPGGTASPSEDDKKLLALIKQAGSPQKTSSILPLGKEPVKFTSKGLKK